MTEDIEDPSREWNTREYLDDFYGDRPYLDPWRYATIHVTASEAACLRAASERFLAEFKDRDGRLYDWKQGVRQLFEREIGYDYEGPGVNDGKPLSQTIDEAVEDVTERGAAGAKIEDKDRGVRIEITPLEEN